MPTTDRLSNIARARVSAVVLDEASGRERAATEVFNKVDADGDGTITKQEFAPFYEKLKSQAYHDAEVKQRAESKIFKLKGRSPTTRPATACRATCRAEQHDRHARAYA